MASPLLVRVSYTPISSSSSWVLAPRAAYPQALQTSITVLLSDNVPHFDLAARSGAISWKEEQVHDSSFALPAEDSWDQVVGDEKPWSGQQPLAIPAFNSVLRNFPSELGTENPPVRLKMEPGGGDTEMRSPGTIGTEGMTQVERQEFLWRNFFLDPTQWWDNRRDKRTPRHPDFRHKRSREPLWLDNRCKPAWVDSKLARWDVEQAAGLNGRFGSPAGGNQRAQIRSEDMLAGHNPDLSERIAHMWRDFFGLYRADQVTEAMDVLDSLQQLGSYADTSLFYRLLKTCIAQKDLALGKRVHSLTLQCGYEANTFLANHLICMYTSHGRLEDATEVFAKVPAPNTYMWASIIKANAELGESMQALKLYKRMQERGVKADNYVFVAVLQACARAADLAFGKKVHSDILDSGLQPDIFVGNGLVDMYAKCGSLEDARNVFDRLPTKDVVTWTAMIGGYAQHELGHEALSIYASMEDEGITSANEATYLCLLQACANVGAVHRGKQLHAQIQQRGLEADAAVGLVDMYAKCGSLEDARRLVDRICSTDVVTWTALLNGYAEHSFGQRAIQCFEEMMERGVKPDAATFACLLVACSHAGLVNEGRQFYNMMVKVHGINPNIRHYTCMVDLLGRSGHLDEAEDMLRTMPFENDVVAWTSLLSACKSHGDCDLGKRCFDHLIKVDPVCSTAYVLLANIYANAGMWRDAAVIESLRKSAGAWKKPAKACIEVKSKVHEFTVGEEGAEVSTKVRAMNERLKQEGGHVPQTELVMKAVSDMEKEDTLCGHAEKLALAFGLLNTPSGATLLVTKNLRMCNDCHSGTKIMSRFENREIIVRDSHRVHHFVDGSCSCGNRH